MLASQQNSVRRCRTFRHCRHFAVCVIDCVRLWVEGSDHLYVLTGKLLDTDLTFQTIHLISGAKDPLPDLAREPTENPPVGLMCKLMK